MICGTSALGPTNRERKSEWVMDGGSGNRKWPTDVRNEINPKKSDWTDADEVNQEADKFRNR